MSMPLRLISFRHSLIRTVIQLVQLSQRSHSCLRSTSSNISKKQAVKPLFCINPPLQNKHFPQPQLGYCKYTLINSHTFLGFFDRLDVLRCDWELLASGTTLPSLFLDSSDWILVLCGGGGEGGGGARSDCVSSEGLDEGEGDTLLILPSASGEEISAKSVCEFLSLAVTPIRSAGFLNKLPESVSPAESASFLDTTSPAESACFLDPGLLDSMILM